MSYTSLFMILNFTIYTFVFIFGICIGSFLNVCIYRIPQGISISKGRSFCPSCHHQLHAMDLIPLFSYLFLKRKCRYCHELISPRYFCIELLTGILFILIYHMNQMSVLFFLNCSFASLLLVIALIDYDTMDIYDYNHICFILLAILRLLFVHDESIISMLLGAIIISLPLLIIYFLTKGGIGMGDIKLMASTGLFLGFNTTLVAFIIGTILAALVGIYYLIRGQKEIQDRMAFGPFLAIGLFIASLYGNILISFYLSLF